MNFITYREEAVRQWLQQQSLLNVDSELKRRLGLLKGEVVCAPYQEPNTGILQKKQESKMSAFKEVKEDFTKFIKEHKAIIYGVLAIALIDRFYLNGALEARVKAMLQKLVSGLEDKVTKLGIKDETPN